MFANTVAHNRKYFPRLYCYLMTEGDKVKFMPFFSMILKLIGEKTQEKPPFYYYEKAHNKKRTSDTSLRENMEKLRKINPNE